MDKDMDDRLEDMICDIGEPPYMKAHIYDTLYIDKDAPLYMGCTSSRWWSNKSFIELLDLLKQMLPEDNNLSDHCYETKKILCPMGLEYVKIHAFPNDCILYMKEYGNLDKCPECGESHYKLKSNNGDDHDNVKETFANVNDAKNIRWHAHERKYDGNIRHVVDSLQWKKIDSLFQNFGLEPRNLRPGLATDGMNPFGNLSTNHSSWPDKGVDIGDAYSGEKFKMRAMLFCAINDFPAYGNFAGYSKAFNGDHGFESDPKPLNGDEFYQRQEHLNVVFGKNKNGLVNRNICKKRSVFFDLPYWYKLNVRYCLDVMHVEKNVCDSLIGTLLNILGKNKDNKNSRLDMVKMGMQQQLAPKDRGKRSYLPPACHTLSKKEKKRLFECLHGIKVYQDELEEEAAIILCQLEMYFPPSSFDTMVHLLVHLVRKVRFCDPVYLRWMYLIEQYMKIFKGYTKNHHRPEASIFERYITKEALEFCSNYLLETKYIEISKSRHADRFEGRCTQGLNVKSMNRDVVLEAHFYILNNLSVV
ncbi:uncharacterized protein LOC127094234 [Lathyrus oleraceus]|uniref:uncharacterized protein LOC127094234 n=1 Tax=Pisum sativum TaxID=3888 RepID=UPI0021CFC74B|nr:uncharacterized protein LOC127094234 [Pisum sativum]